MTGGKPGNPGGRPKGKEKLLREILLPHVDKATSALIAALSDPKQSLAAAKEIYDRVYGKAPQAVEMSGDIEITVTLVKKLGAQIVQAIDHED